MDNSVKQSEYLWLPVDGISTGVLMSKTLMNHVLIYFSPTKHCEVLLNHSFFFILKALFAADFNYKTSSIANLWTDYDLMSKIGSFHINKACDRYSCP